VLRAIRALRLWMRGRPAVSDLPLAEGWTASRDFPAPEAGTFMAQWRAGRRR
jgi:L-lactate dehydrogenase complex protein LldF